MALAATSLAASSRLVPHFIRTSIATAASFRCEERSRSLSLTFLENKGGDRPRSRSLNEAIITKNGPASLGFSCRTPMKRTMALAREFCSLEAAIAFAFKPIGSIPTRFEQLSIGWFEVLVWRGSCRGIGHIPQLTESWPDCYRSNRSVVPQFEFQRCVHWTLPTSQGVLILCPLELTIWIYSWPIRTYPPISRERRAGGLN